MTRLLDYAPTEKRPTVRLPIARRQFVAAPEMSAFDARLTPRQSALFPLLRLVCQGADEHVWYGSLDELQAVTRRACSMGDLERLQKLGVIAFVGREDGLFIAWKGGRR